MAKLSSIGKIFLWLYVISLGVELGAGLYETLVVMPLWQTAPPDSVIAYYQHNAANPQFTLNAGGRFWMVATPLVGLTSIAAFLTGFRTRSEQRKWLIIGTVLGFLVVVWTFAWFVPNIMKLHGPSVLAMSPDEVASLANNWVRFNIARIVVYSTAWLATLRAFSLSSETEVVS